MALPEISLAQFNKIATGAYNAGQIDIQVGQNGQAELVKINNHVWRTGKNNVMLSPERILEVKEAFLNALEKAKVPREKMNEIRARIGLPAEMDVATGEADGTPVVELPLPDGDGHRRYRVGTVTFARVSEASGLLNRARRP